jgi:hypothetical protein
MEGSLAFSAVVILKLMEGFIDYLTVKYKRWRAGVTVWVVKS